MATLNKVMLIGRLTKPPEEPRVLPNSGTTVVKFRFAVGRSKKVGDNWEKDPNQLYIDCEVFSRQDSKRNLAELVTKYVKQGDPLYLEGRLVFEEWEKDGQKRSKHKLVVDSLEFLGGRGEGGGGGEDEYGGGGRQSSGGYGSGRQSYGGGRPAGGGGKPADGGRSDAPPQDGDENDGGSGGSGGEPIPF